MPMLSDEEGEEVPARLDSEPVIPPAAVPTDVWAGLGVILGLTLRIPQLHGNVPALRVHIGSILAAALCPANYFLRRGWYQRHRARLVLLTRVLVGLCLAAKYDMPSTLRSTSGPSLATTFLIYTGALPLLFVCVGFQVPFALHLLLVALQLGAGLPKALQRCSAAPGGFLHHFPPDWFTAMVEVLDWPFYCVAPAAMIQERGRMPPQAACLATAMWTQLTLAGLVPPVLFHLLEAQQAAQPGEAVLRRRDPLLQAWLSDTPLLMFAYTAQLLWIVLRAAIGAAFAEPLPASP